MNTKVRIPVASMAALALPLVIVVGCAGTKQNVANTDAGHKQAVQTAIAAMDGYMAQLDLQQENMDDEVSSGAAAATQTELSTEEEVSPVPYEHSKEETLLQSTEITDVIEEAIFQEAETTVANKEALLLETEVNADNEEIGEGEEKYLMAEPQQTTFYFDSNSDTPAAIDHDILLQHAQYLQEHPKVVLVINGHSDSRGSKAYNQRLSEQRALNVAYVLLEVGVSGEQLRIEGMGDAVPRIDPANFQENRRVEFTYMDSMMAKNN